MLICVINYLTFKPDGKFPYSWFYCREGRDLSFCTKLSFNLYIRDKIANHETETHLPGSCRNWIYSSVHTIFKIYRQIWVEYQICYRTRSCKLYFQILDFRFNHCCCGLSYSGCGWRKKSIYEKPLDLFYYYTLCRTFFFLDFVFVFEGSQKG